MTTPKKLPVIRIRPYNETGEAKAHVPTRRWSVMKDAEKREVWQTLLTTAMMGAFGDHPGCYFRYHFRELYPDAADLVDPTKEPEVVCICNVSMYEHLPR